MPGRRCGRHVSSGTASSAASAETAIAALLLDRADRAQGDLCAAIESATCALAGHREAGHRLGAEQTVALLARAGAPIPD
jgi:hypothetical protein